MNHRARRAAGAEHHRFFQIAIPAWRAGVETVQKTFDVGIGRTQRAAVKPQRIGGADGAGARVRLRAFERRLLMGHGYIGAGIAARGERLRKGAEFFRPHGLGPVRAGNAVSLQPVIMNEWRPRMLDRPADDASGALAPRHASSTTVLRNTPISGHSTSIVSPGFSHTGGSTFGVFFTGVPVQTTSPALSVMKLVV